MRSERTNKKSDLRLLRLAVSRELITPQQAEECLFRKRKFGDRYTVQDVLRRANCINEEQLEGLVAERAEIEAEERERNRRGWRRLLFWLRREEEEEEEEIGEEIELEEDPDESEMSTVMMDPASLLAAIALHSKRASDKIFGDYLIRRPIGKTRMGKVYLAQPEDGGAAVALQVLDPHLADSPDYVLRFQRGAEVADIVDSPHLERFLDRGNIGDQYFNTVAYVDGWTLEERIASGDIPQLKDALRITRDVAKGLEVLADNYIVHRNIKPGTILVRSDGSAVLTDLGLSAALELGPDWLKDRRGGIVGTPNYIAPEQATGHFDHRADLYSLGATLFEMIVGRSIQTVSDPREPFEQDLTGLKENAPPGVVALVMKLTARTPQQRFSHPAEVVTAIEALLASGNLGAAALDARRGISPLYQWGAPAAAVLLAILIAIAFGNTSLESPSIRFITALVGCIGVGLALLLFPPVALVRVGRLPIPSSTASLVIVSDVLGVIGAVWLVGGLSFGAPSIINLVVSFMALLVLGSWVHGVLLRLNCSQLRIDRGVGRMLSVLSEPSLLRWRSLHVPLVSTLSLFALVRVAFVAYFRAHTG